MTRRHNVKVRPSSGFTLIELMVAMLLGLIVIAGVVSVFLATQQSYRTNQALGDVQDSSRIAFEMMARDIRDAGLTGCDNSGRIGNVLANGPNKGGTPAWWANIGNGAAGYGAVAGYGAGTTTTDPALTVGTAAGQQVTGTDSVALLGAAESGLSVLSDNQVTAQFVLNEVSSTLQAGDVLMVCDPDHSAIFQVTSYASASKTVNYVTGSGTPGNCSQGLDYPTACTTTGNSYTFSPNAQIAEMTAADWYLGNNPVGGTSLYRMVLNNATGQEMVRDVTAMSILYHQPPNTSFVAAKAVTNWGLVDAIQVALTVQSTDQRAGTDVKPISRTFTATTTIRNRVK